MNHKYTLSRESAVTIVEASMMLPLILLLVLLLFDLMRYLSVKSALESYALQGLTLASVVPNLEQPATQNKDGKFEEARAQVAARVRQVEHSWLFGTPPISAHLIGPLSDEDIVFVPDKLETEATRDSAMAKEPIRIKIHAAIGLLSFPGIWQIPLEARAIGFREPRIATSNPIPLACDGRPLMPGNDIVCACPVGKHVNVNTGGCDCNECTQGKLLNVVDCSCTCPAPFVSTDLDCVCAPEVVENCVNKGRSFNSKTCECEDCPAPLVVNPSNGQCVCALALPNAPGCIMKGSILETTSCQCICPGNTIEVNGECVCPETTCSDNQQPQPAPACGCGCPGSCGDYQVHDSSCTCRCRDGLIWNPTTNSCECPRCPKGQIQTLGAPLCACGCPDCPAGQKPTQDGSCGCTACPSCPDPNMHQGVNTCECFCPETMSEIRDENGSVVACDIKE